MASMASHAADTSLTAGADDGSPMPIKTFQGGIPAPGAVQDKERLQS